MTGSVSGRRPRLPVTLRLTSQPDFAIDFIVDTGFTGFLSLPVPPVNLMGLPFLHHLSANLADGSSLRVPVHALTILWEGMELNVRVLATGKNSLLGTALLDGHELVAQFREGGAVTITEL